MLVAAAAAAAALVQAVPYTDVVCQRYTVCNGMVWPLKRWALFVVVLTREVCGVRCATTCARSGRCSWTSGCLVHAARRDPVNVLTGSCRDPRVPALSAVQPQPYQLRDAGHAQRRHGPRLRHGNRGRVPGGAAAAHLGRGPIARDDCQPGALAHGPAAYGRPPCGGVRACPRHVLSCSPKRHIDSDIYYFERLGVRICHWPVCPPDFYIIVERAAEQQGIELEWECAALGNNNNIFFPNLTKPPLVFQVATSESPSMQTSCARCAHGWISPRTRTRL